MLGFILFIVFLLEIIQLCLLISTLRTSDNVYEDLFDLGKKIKRIEKQLVKRGKK